MSLVLLFKAFQIIGVWLCSYGNSPPKWGVLLMTPNIYNNFPTHVKHCILTPRALIDFIQRLLLLWVMALSFWFGDALFPDKASISTPPQSTFHPSLVTGFFLTHHRPLQPLTPPTPSFQGCISTYSQDTNLPLPQPSPLHPWPSSNIQSHPIITIHHSLWFAPPQTDSCPAQTQIFGTPS